MKKLLITGLALIAFLLPSLAQVDHDYNANDLIPVVSTNLTKDKVPAVVIKAANTQFDMSNPQTWSKFPFAIKEYGFVYDKDASDIKPDRYIVNLKTKEGNDLSAVYSAAGDLIETREMSVNVAIPSSVREALSNSQYKDWTIVGNREIIRAYHDHYKSNVEQHFRVTVEKDKARRSISFNYQGTANK
jgi:hypothetical protein